MASKNVEEPNYLQNYTDACEKCKHNCLKSKDGVYLISNIEWERNQRQMEKDREKLSRTEKDFILRQAIYAKLKEKSFKSTSEKVPLSFDVFFEFPSEVKKINLCESCFVCFHNHKCKLYSIIIFN